MPSQMPGTTAVGSDDVWTKAVVTKNLLPVVQPCSGLPHMMSLPRRVRASIHPPPSFDIRVYLTPDEEIQVLSVLRQHFVHEQHITCQDIRFVVRTIAAHGGSRQLPSEFPSHRWVLNFKRVHGFAKSSLGLGTTMTPENSAEGSYYIVPTFQASRPPGSDYLPQQQQQPLHQLDHYQAPQTQSQTQSQTRDQVAQQAQAQIQLQQQIQAQNIQRQQQLEQQQRTRGQQQQQHSEYSHSDNRDEVGSTDNSSSRHEEPAEPKKKKRCFSSATVPAETWQKAIAAVQQQGMSLRAAARMFDVHFAALHRLVKKRGEVSNGYFSPVVEAGIVRVVVARAELRVLMSYDELTDLVQRTALRNLPELSVTDARKLMNHFESRNGHKVHSFITNWPNAKSTSIDAIVSRGNSRSHTSRSSRSSNDSRCQSSSPATSSISSSSSDKPRITTTPEVPDTRASTNSPPARTPLRRYCVDQYPSPSAPTSALAPTPTPTPTPVPVQASPHVNSTEATRVAGAFAPDSSWWVPPQTGSSSSVALMYRG